MDIRGERLQAPGIGGIREIRRCWTSALSTGSLTDIEMIQMSQIKEAYKRLLKSDVKYRFVIDMASLHQGHGDLIGSPVGFAFN